MKSMIKMTNGLYWLFQTEITESLLDIFTEMIEIDIDLNTNITKKTILHSMCENYKNPDLLEMFQKMIESSKRGTINQIHQRF